MRYRELLSSFRSLSSIPDLHLRLIAVLTLLSRSRKAADLPSLRSVPLRSAIRSSVAGTDCRGARVSNGDTFHRGMTVYNRYKIVEQKVPLISYIFEAKNSRPVKAAQIMK